MMLFIYLKASYFSSNNSRDTSFSAFSEHLVQEAIDDMLSRGKNEGGNMTVLIVAHRLSTVRNADQIFVVQGGKVVEEGKHDDLLERDGPYAQLIKRQMEAHSKLENGKAQS